MNIMNSNWWQHAVIYQIYPRSFYDSNSDGIGDLPGIWQKLDYVASLGVDAVWISPFYPSPMADFGYDVQDYCGVDPMFGTLADFKAVLEKAHQLNLKVLMDQVWCHTSNQHPWFIESCKDRTNSKADWYVWVDGNAEGQAPNNWLAIFGGQAWTWHPGRQQYYLHHFLQEQPALNWYNPAVQQAMLDVGRFWLELGVDGFRFDVINFLMHDLQLRDNPHRPQDAPLPAGGNRQIPFFQFINRYNIGQDATYEMVKAIRALLDEYPGSTSLAEISCAEDALAEASQAVSSERLHLAYNSSLMTEEPFTPSHLRQIVEEAGGLLENGGLCWTAGTHDFPRLASRWHQHLLHDLFDQEAFNYMLAALLLTLPGSCCLYQGDELGLPEAEIAFEDMQDPFGIKHYPDFPGRDGCRTPMPWVSQAPQYGFTQNSKPWLPVALSHQELAVDLQESQKHSLLNKYRRLIAWRQQQPALRQSLKIRVIETTPGLFGYIRGEDTTTPLLFLLNFTDQTIYQQRDPLPRCTYISDLHASGVRQFHQQLEIPPYGLFVAHCES
jgi:alpha-glucosidase